MYKQNRESEKYYNFKDANLKATFEKTSWHPLYRYTYVPDIYEVFVFFQMSSKNSDTFQGCSWMQKKSFLPHPQMLIDFG